MQKDFHLGAMYVACRMVGFSSFESDIIAGSSQFVDDAVHEGILNFNNKYIYEFHSSAHRQIDYRNFVALKNHKAWIPFHFIPAGVVDGFYPEATDEKLVCRPNSQISQEMLKTYFPYFKEVTGLYHLGVMLHSYVDTWAHQGFSGFTSPLNKVQEIFNEEINADINVFKKVKNFYKLKRSSPKYKIYKKTQLKIFKNYIDIIWEKIKSKFVSGINPIGHGAVLSFPDLPYLVWQYKNWRGEIITRNNPEDFYQAFLKVIEYLQELRAANKLSIHQIKESDLVEVKLLLTNTINEDENFRLNVWKDSILSQKFTFGVDVWKYECNELASWTQEVFTINSDLEFNCDNLIYSNDFLNSHWKLVHDAIVLHRYLLVNKVLPKFDICAF